MILIRTKRADEDIAEVHAGNYELQIHEALTNTGRAMSIK